MIKIIKIVPKPENVPCGESKSRFSHLEQMLRIDRLSKLDFTNQPAVQPNPGNPVDGLDPDDGLVGTVGEEAEVQPDSEPH